MINWVNATPIAVNPGQPVNLTSNVTNNQGVDKVLVNVNRSASNSSMAKYSTDLYYYDQFNTNISPGVYNYTVYANDTSHLWAVPVTANFTVNAVCGISLNNYSMQFGNVSVGVESAEKTVNISNSGNALANITVRGTNWTGTGQLPSQKTAYSNSSGNFASKFLMNITDAFVQQMNAWSNMLMYFQFKPDLGTSAGTYSQNITITSTC